MAVYNKISVIYNGVTTDITPYGRTYSENNELIAREERAADGTLRRDVTALKKRFTLSYDLIDGDKIELFENILTSGASVDLLVERHSGSYEKYDVLLQSFGRERKSARGHGLWSGFSAEFVEV